MMRTLALVVLAAGCLEVPKPPGQECKVNSDCDSGEVCTAGVCYGNPPDGTFAATVSAPSTRTDVIATELGSIELPQDGAFGEIQLEAPVTISGRVEAHCAAGGNTTCSQLSIGAQIRLTRPSRIPGAPALRFSVQSKPDLPRGTDSFVIRVPRTLPGDEPWTVTIDPDGGGDAPATDGGTDPAELVPPRRLSLYVTDDIEHQTYTLGEALPIVISGSLRDAFQNTLTKYRVVALGRWEGETAMTEVSTVDFTSDGNYSITLAENVMAPLEIVARPYGDNDVSPALRLQNVEVATVSKNLSQPTGLGQRKTLDLPIEVLDGSEGVKPIAGVRVIVTAAIESTLTENLRAEFRAEATTDEEGIAKLAVLDGAAFAGNYSLRIIPPASSTYGVVYSGAFDPSAPMPVRLPPRVKMRGTVLDIDGAPVAATSVTARRSQRFLWSVAPADQAFLDEIPAATALTTDTGEFLLWVDPAIADTWATYDLFFETPSSSAAPNWRMADQDLPRQINAEARDLGAIVLPDAARFHAKIVASDGTSVEGADLRIFQIYSNDTVCMEVGHPPDICAPATVVQGHAESDDVGKLTLTLPRP